MPFYTYEVRNERDGKRYVGQSHAPTKRWALHLRSAFLPDDHPRKRALHKAISKDGPHWFTFEILATHATLSKALANEKYWIAQYKTLDPAFGYNRNEGGTSSGFPDVVIRAKISAATKGKKKNISLEMKERVSKERRGRIVSGESRAKMSAARVGKKASDETKAKMSAAWDRRRSRSMSEREIMARVALKKRNAGRSGIPLSEETRAKMSAARTGLKRTPEQCENIRKARIGRKLSEEFKLERRAKKLGFKLVKVDDSNDDE